ncbi:MAG TPA: ABC transporter transmembrane domain-containing protein, partial [Caulobacteraceae bacterium]|nr:ABC transporter transmembrane domain-containing protein [Caulobacteraceae bacterium]
MSSIDAPVADGRPGAGQLLAAEMQAEAQTRAKRRNLKPLGKLLPFVGRHWGDAVASTMFLAISTGATLLITQAIRLLVDKGLAGKTAAELNAYFLFAALVALVLSVATSGRFFFISRLGERVVADVRETLYRHVMSLDQGYFAEVRTGEVLARLTTDMTIVENMVGTSISVALRNLLTFLGAFAWMVWLTPAYTGLVLLIGAVVAAPLVVGGRTVRRLSAFAQERFARAVAYAGETIDGLDTVQAFGREQSAIGRFDDSVETAFRASVGRITARAYMTGLVMICLFGGVSLILWRLATAAFVDHDPSITGGVIVQFIILAGLTGGAVGALGETWGDIQKTAGAMERISEILDAKPAIAAPAA